MTVESASYISQLDTTLPTAADLISEGDDHLRLTKTVLKTQFPNFGATAITASAAEVNYLVGVTSAIQPQLSNQVAGPVHAATAKTTPVDADELGITDSAASWGLKKLTFANLKAWIGSFFVSKSGDTMNGPFTVSGARMSLRAANEPYGLQVNYGSTTNGRFIGGESDGSLLISTDGGAPVARVDTGNNLSLVGGGTLGYGVGSGGTVTQATSKSTAVTLNKPSGQITMSNAALAAGQTVSFVLNNSLLSVGDALLVTVDVGVSGGAGQYQAWGYGCGWGTAQIALRNNAPGSLSDAVVLGFKVIKGATS